MTHCSKEKLDLKGVEWHLDLRSPMFAETNASLSSSPTFNGIDEIIEGFIPKVDRPKALKIKLNLSMPKRTPKRRSPNIGERKLKWAITVRRPQISFKCNKI